MEQTVIQPTHSAHQECQTVYMAYLVSPLQPLQPTGITEHLFPDHLDFAHIVPYLALGMNIILSLSVQFSSHSEISITPFSIPEPLQRDPSLPRRIA